MVFTREDFNAKNKEAEDRLGLYIRHLRGKHYLGACSISRRMLLIISHPNQVKYYGKFEHVDTGNMPHRDGSYDYEQFVLPSWKDFCDLTNRPGGPIGRTNYQVKQEPDHSHIG